MRKTQTSLALGIAASLLFAFIVFPDGMSSVIRGLRAQITQMSFTVHPAPFIVTGGVTFFPSQSEGHRFEASEGGTFRFENPDGSYVIITFFSETTQAALDFFIDAYEENAVIGDRPLPTGKNVVGGLIYDMRAFEGATAIATFQSPFSMLAGYLEEHVAGLDEETLDIYFWDESQQEWITFPDSTRDTEENTVTILTDHLTLFAALGTVTSEGGVRPLPTPEPTVEGEKPKAEEDGESKEGGKEALPEGGPGAEEGGESKEKIVSQEESPSGEISEKETPLAEEPEAAETEFEITLTVLNQGKTVHPGEDLLVWARFIRLQPRGGILPLLHYRIRDENNDVILDHTETMAVETRVSFQKTFHIVEDARFGTYMISLEISYGDVSLVALDTFTISEKTLFDVALGPDRAVSESRGRSLGVILGTFFVLVLLALGFWNWKKLALENPE